MLSAGAAANNFERVVAHAARAGAAGFLAGRALWSDALDRWPDHAAVAQHLQSTGLARLRRLKALLASEGQAWQPPAWNPDVTAEGDFARARLLAGKV